jgi:hypothetical protein
MFSPFLGIVSNLLSLMLTRILTANKNQIRMVSAILCKIWYQKVHFLILFDFSSVPIDKSDNIVYDFTRYLLKSVGLQVIYFTKQNGVAGIKIACYFFVFAFVI